MKQTCCSVICKGVVKEVEAGAGCISSAEAKWHQTKILCTGKKYFPSSIENLPIDHCPEGDVKAISYDGNVSHTELTQIYIRNIVHW